MKASVAAFISLLASLELAAQPFVGQEVASVPFPNRPALVELASPAVAMAKDARGVVIAWAMPGAAGNNSIHLARLDSKAMLTGSIVEVPRSSTETDAVYPSLALQPGGGGFTLAWSEFPASPAGVKITSGVYCLLDPDLRPSPPQVLMSVPTPGVITPALVSSDQSTWITFFGNIWKIYGASSYSPTIVSGLLGSSDLAVVGDYAHLIAAQRVSRPDGCSCPISRPIPGCPSQCVINDVTYSFQHLTLYKSLRTYPLTFNSNTHPAVERAGGDVLAAWFDTTPSAGVHVAAAFIPDDRSEEWNIVRRTLGPSAPDAALTRPDIATDGDLYFVAWQTAAASNNHDIVGATLDRAGNVTYLPIATSAGDERAPSVIAISPGTFLVAYEKRTTGERRIAGRIVTLNKRRRAVQ